MSKILLVEDNEMNREMLVHRLRRNNYTVVYAIDGLEAVEMADSESPDLILINLGLPKIDGWEAIRRIKSNEALCSIPLMVLTSRTLRSELESALETGCDDFDVKPVDFKRLLPKVENLINKKNGQKFMI